MSPRRDGRSPEALRPVVLRTGVQRNATGSVEIAMGGTRVLCAVTLSDEMPRWLRGSGKGWLTAEYGMLPASTNTRTQREAASGRVKGRTHEIQRLIGRALRGVLDLKALGERQLAVDCDVLEADGGTRTASITGSWVALALALEAAHGDGRLPRLPALQPLAAVSVGIVEGRPLLDLCYEEDAAAEVDMNVVMVGDGRFVEVQGTAEGAPFARAELDALLDLAAGGCRDLFLIQQGALAQARQQA